MSEWLLFVWRARNHKIKATCLETKGPLDKLLFRFRTRDLAPEIRSELEHIVGGIPSDVVVVTGGDSLRLLPRTVASGILGVVKRKEAQMVEAVREVYKHRLDTEVSD